MSESINETKFCKCLHSSMIECPKTYVPDMTCKECLWWDDLPCLGCSCAEKCKVRKNLIGGNKNEGT